MNRRGITNGIKMNKLLWNSESKFVEINKEQLVISDERCEKSAQNVVGGHSSAFK